MNTNTILVDDHTLMNDLDDEAVLSGSLGGLGVRGILAEGDRLERERCDLSAGTRALAFERYRAFIAASEAGNDVADRVNDAHLAAENVTSLLPSLREKCSSFEDEATALSERRKRVSLVLAKHTRLLEILELPQLVETCVRNGHYEEALELRQFSCKIDRKLGSIPLVASVVKAVQGSMKVMLQSLLAQLRTAIQLPACLRVVGYLRRMDIFTETELRLRFLQARDSWLSGTLSSIVDGSDPHQHLSKTMDATRVHLFDIATQYRALFSDDDVISITNYSNSGVFRNTSNIFQGSSSHRVLFSAWLDRRISIFLETLRTDIDKIVLATKQRSIGQISINYGGLDSLLNQAMYFGQSFGRIGADFRLCLVPVFQDAALAIALGILQGADSKFSHGVEELALKASLNARMQNTGDYTQADGSTRTTGQNKNETESKDDINPPMSLLEFPPLAELCNTILLSFNEIRLVTPLAIAPKLISTIQSLLLSSAKSLADKERRFSKNKSTTETELSAFGRMVYVFVRDFLPHIERVVKLVFSPSLMSNILSTNSNTIMNSGKDCFNKCQLTLDVPVIVELLPEKYVPTVSVPIYDNKQDQMSEHETKSENLDSKKSSQGNEAATISVQEASPPAKLPDCHVIEDDKIQSESNDLPSSYVIDRVDIIANEIEESKLSDNRNE